ncbi:MAG: glycosyltransferase family 39 protein [Anaerolineaceae bacterium]|nr:glycosyltransferase family 39 protein [Anaerolineaceae bacterium]
MSLTSTHATPAEKTRSFGLIETIFDLALIVLIFLGIIFRFGWTNWSQGANLHPDEYGLTNTLTQLRLPSSLGDYFNTRISPLSPYTKYGLTGFKIADGPDNGMRWGQWPIIVLRAAAELTRNTGYSELRLMGRSVSALLDTFSILLIGLTGRRLYGRRTGLLATALSALAVLQIQSSHFMTVDAFGTLFTCLVLYAGVRITQTPGLVRSPRRPTARPRDRQDYWPNHSIWKWYLLFGVALGMALASRINLLPLGGMILVAAFLSIAPLTLRTSRDLDRIAMWTLVFLMVVLLSAAVTFRLTQPMSFRAASGDTSLFTMHLNPEWTNSLKAAQLESSGIGGGPPSEQWANRPIITFPLANMVLWGLGLPLGIAAWYGFAWALYQTLRGHLAWSAHLLPLIWVGGYFSFMATRWVKSIRYFLPIYPFLCLFAAWALIELWKVWSNQQALQNQLLPRRRLRYPVVPTIATVLVIVGTLIWASAFVQAVYRTDHTRIQASKWMVTNIPATFQITLGTAAGMLPQPVAAVNGLTVTARVPYSQEFTALASGSLNTLAIPHVVALGSSAKNPQLEVVIARDAAGTQAIDRADVLLEGPPTGSSGASAHGRFLGASLAQGERYFLIARLLAGDAVRIARSVISNETWDEGLPVPVLGAGSCNELYTCIEMQVHWPDSVEKRSMFLSNLSQVDYIVLPSQRRIWSSSRLPLTYPMTMEYYRALFDGRLGFDLVEQTSAPLRIGPAYISDLAGSIAWGKPPPLPVFNYSPFAAEEAFSVYDHPPVWIFKKRADFSIVNAERILGAIDLNKVVVQSPRNATWH